MQELSQTIKTNIAKLLTENCRYVWFYVWIKKKTDFNIEAQTKIWKDKIKRDILIYRCFIQNRNFELGQSMQSDSFTLKKG